MRSPCGVSGLYCGCTCAQPNVSGTQVTRAVVGCCSRLVFAWRLQLSNNSELVSGVFTTACSTRQAWLCTQLCSEILRTAVVSTYLTPVCTWLLRSLRLSLESQSRTHVVECGTACLLLAACVGAVSIHVAAAMWCVTPTVRLSQCHSALHLRLFLPCCGSNAVHVAHATGSCSVYKITAFSLPSGHLP